MIDHLKAPRPKGVMHLLFDIFVIPPAVIAGVVFIATWNVRDAVVAFRVNKCFG